MKFKVGDIVDVYSVNNDQWRTGYRIIFISEISGAYYVENTDTWCSGWVHENNVREPNTENESHT